MGAQPTVTPPTVAARVLASRHAAGIARVCVVSLTGDFDLGVAHQFETEISDVMRAGVRNFVVDLRGVTSLDAPISNVLVLGRKRAERRNGAFVLVTPEQEVWRPLVRSAADSFMTFTSERAAVHHLLEAEEKR